VPETVGPDCRPPECRPPVVQPEIPNRLAETTIYWCICKLFKYVAKHTTTRARRAPVPKAHLVSFALYLCAVCIYTRKWYTPAIFLFFRGPNPVVVHTYLYGVLTRVPAICVQHRAVPIATLPFWRPESAILTPLACFLLLRCIPFHFGFTSNW